MTRSFRMFVLVLAVALALLVAPAVAAAQDADPDTPALPYPGPFGDDDAGDADADDGDATDDASTDEVLGETVVANTGTQPISERSIDYLGDDAGSYFIAPDIQPSPDAVAAEAAGGTGGGLAVTGSTVEPIIAISVGLLAVGGSAVVSSRRRLRDFFN